MDIETGLALESMKRDIGCLYGKAFQGEMFSQSESIKELSKAMVKAQMAIEDPKKSSDNPYFHSKYADLSEVRSALRVPLADAGIAYFQFAHVDYSAKIQRKAAIKDDEGRKMGIGDITVPLVSVVTKLVHAESGEWVSMVLSAAPRDDSPQAIGSIITYLRRYGLKTIVGMADEESDDDGNRGSGREIKQPQGQQGDERNNSTSQNKKAQKLGDLKKPEDIRDAKGRVRWVVSKKCLDDIIQAEEGLISTAEFHQISALVTVQIKPTKEKTERAIFGSWLASVYKVEFYDISKPMFAGIVETLKLRPQEIQKVGEAA